MASILFYNETDTPVKFGLLDGGTRNEYSSGIVPPRSKGPQSVGGPKGQFIVSVWSQDKNGNWSIYNTPGGAGNATRNGYACDFTYSGAESSSFTIITLKSDRDEAISGSKISIAKTTNPPF